MKKLGFGLAGCGMIGSLHAGVIHSLDQGYLAAVCDSDPEKAKAFAARWNCKAFTDYQEMLRDPEVQAVAVCLPSGMHSAFTIEAAKAGRHVICEKPIDILPDRAQEMVDACKSCGVELGVIMQHRFDKPVLALKQAIENGKLGRLLWGAARTIWYRDDEYYSNPWRGTWKYDGGGALINQSIHYIDLLLHIFGKPKRVSGRCGTLLHHQIETEDVGLGHIEFENGCLGTVEGTTVAYPGLYAELAVFAEKGTVIIRNDELLFCRMQEPDEPLMSLLNPEKANALRLDPGISDESHRRQYQDFTEAVLSGKRPAVTGEDAIESLRVICGIYESSRDNCIQEI